MKKIISGILTVLMLTSTAFAGGNMNIITIDGLYSGKAVTVTVNYPEDYADRGTMYIVPETGLSSAVNGDLSQAIYVGESENITNAPSYEFEMPDSAQNGVYVIVTDGGVAGTENCSKRFMYNKDASAVDTGLDNLKGSADTKSVIENGAEDLWYVDTDNSVWKNSATEVTALAESLADDEFDSAKEVEDTIAIAMDIIGANNQDKILADILYYNDVLGCNITDGEFNQNQDEVMELFLDYLKEDSPSSKTELQEMFREACGITCINNTTPEECIYDLKAYNDIFELNFGGDYTKVDTYKLAEAIAKEDYTSKEQLRKKFKDAISELKESSSSDNNGSIGGGRGGAGGGGGATAGLATGSGQEIIDQISNANKIFPDVADSHWAKLYIEYVYNSHIMSGDTDGNFRPDDAITREEWIKVVLNTFAIELGDAECEFDDVKADDWFYPYVAKAYELRVINGISENVFGAGNKVTRQDAVVILDRAMKLTRTLISPEEETAVVFTDNGDIAEYAADAINTFSRLEVINGYEDGSFAPKGNITRAEGAKIIKALLDAIE